WNGYNSNNKFQQTPAQIPRLFPYSRFVLYAENINLPTDPSSTSFDSIALTYNIQYASYKSNQIIQVRIPLNIQVVKGNLIHKLAARSEIKELNYQLKQ